MRAGMLLFLVVASSCTPREWRAADRTSLGAAVALTACDYAGTERGAAAGWRDSSENNMLLGPTPSAPAVDGYFALALGAEVGLWWLLPARYRTGVLAGVAGAELETIIGNVKGVGWCGQGPAWVDRP